MFILYNGVVNSNNVAVDIISEKSLKLQDIYNNHFKNWLRFRANAFVYTDTYLEHFTSNTNINQGIFKYEKKHLVKSIKKTRISTEHYKVDVESESF